MIDLLLLPLTTAMPPEYARKDENVVIVCQSKHALTVPGANLLRGLQYDLQSSASTYFAAPPDEVMLRKNVPTFKLTASVKYLGRGVMPPIGEDEDFVDFDI